MCRVRRLILGVLAGLPGCGATRDRQHLVQASVVHPMLRYAVHLCQEQWPSVPFLARLLPA